MLQARNTSMLAQCFYQLEDFASLTKLVEVLTEGQPLLADIGGKLLSVGLCKPAVAAFTKVSNSTVLGSDNLNAASLPSQLWTHVSCTPRCHLKSPACLPACLPCCCSTVT